MKKYIQTRQYEGSLKMEKRGMAWEKVGLIKERSDRFKKKKWKEKLAVLWGKGKERKSMKQNYIMGKIWRKYVALYPGQCQCVNEIRTTSFRSVQLLGEYVWHCVNFPKWNMSKTSDISSIAAMNLAFVALS